MHRRQFSGARTKLDLNDRVQVRIVRKRLKVSSEQLASLVRTAGGSIAAVSKEAGDRRRLTLPGSRMPSAEVIASVKEPEVTPEAEDRRSSADTTPPRCGDRLKGLSQYGTRPSILDF